MSDIFISYASEDRAIAQNLARALGTRGWSVWWDRRILPGQSFHRVIQAEIGCARCMLVLWSSASVESDWTMDEAAVGKQRGVLVPALIERVQIPLGFQSIQAADLVGWRGDEQAEGFAALTDAIAHLLVPADGDDGGGENHSAIRSEGNQQRQLSTSQELHEPRQEQPDPPPPPTTGLAKGSASFKHLAVQVSEHTSGQLELARRGPQLASFEPLRKLEGHTGPVASVAFSPDGQLLASGSWDFSVRLWRVADGHLARDLGPHDGWANSIAFSLDGQLLAVGRDGHYPQGKIAAIRDFFSPTDTRVRLWRVADGQLLWMQEGEKQTDCVVAFSPGNDVLATAGDTNIRLLRAVDGQLVQTLEKTDSAKSIAFSSDGQLLAFTCPYRYLTSGLRVEPDRSVWLCRVAENRLMRKLDGHEDRVWNVAFSHDGQLLASVSADKTVRLWRVVDGQPIQTLKGHTKKVGSVAFSPDGQILASGSDDGTVRLWRLADGQLIQTLTPHVGYAVTSIAFSPDGQLLASGSFDHNVWLWLRDQQDVTDESNRSA